VELTLHLLWELVSAVHEYASVSCPNVRQEGRLKRAQVLHNYTIAISLDAHKEGFATRGSATAWCKDDHNLASLDVGEAIDVSDYVANGDDVAGLDKGGGCVHVSARDFDLKADGKLDDL